METIAPMAAADIPRALALWRGQFDRHCRDASFPDIEDGGEEAIARYLLARIEARQALVAMRDGVLAGYMAWLYFDFHGEPSAFVPTVGSAADAQEEAAVLHALYAEASRAWVREGRLNHLWMTFHGDSPLRDVLYEVGFGSHVIDACQSISEGPLPAAAACAVTRAGAADVDAVCRLGNDAERNLLRAPVFLLRAPWQRAEIAGLIREQPVFAAWDQGRMIGVLSLDMGQRFHTERLTRADSAYIGGIGAYVEPAYRGRGIGTALLRYAFAHCREAGKQYLHVSYETANPDARVFWPRHFRPAIRSVRRRVNRDVSGGV